MLRESLDFEANLPKIYSSGLGSSRAKFGYHHAEGSVSHDDGSARLALAVDRIQHIGTHLRSADGTAAEPIDWRNLATQLFHSLEVLALFIQEERRHREQTHKSTGTKTALDIHLTKKQREIMSLANQGLSNTEIAARLGITRSTVNQHLHRLYKHLNVRSRGMATAYCREHQLI